MNDIGVSVALITGKLHRLDVKQCTLVSGQHGKVLDLNIRSVMSSAHNASRCTGSQCQEESACVTAVTKI